MERRQFTREFKLEAVRLIKQRGVSYAQASKDLGVHPTQLRNWVKQLADDPQHAFQVTPNEAGAVGDRAAQARGCQAQGRTRYSKKSRSLLREGTDDGVSRASVSGTGGDWDMSPYNAAKGAVVNLTRALALDMGKKGVRVNSVCPSLTRTGTTEDMMDDKDLLAKFAKRIPLGRACEPEEVAAVIAFLASEDASFMTGANVAVDGGVSPPGPVSHPMIRSALFSVLTDIRTPSSLDVQQIADQRRAIGTFGAGFSCAWQKARP